MGRARTKEECRQQIIKQAKGWLREKRTIYVIGHLWRLRELTEHIENIGLWGGEALLHPQLDELVRLWIESVSCC